MRETYVSASAGEGRRAGASIFDPLGRVILPILSILLNPYTTNNCIWFDKLLSGGHSVGVFDGRQWIFDIALESLRIKQVIQR